MLQFRGPFVFFRSEWLNQPPSAKYLDDIRESATYKFVQELEGRRPSPNAGKTFEQSTTLKNMSRYFGVDSS
uniref:Uncharacterized protein n=1 Tax=Romanomermis culicivorax TaxID=13658 RepID=A0A915IK35_ROMCU